MRNYAQFTVIGLFVLASTSFAHHNKHCKADVEKLCPGIDGKDAVLACLAQHESELSKKCKKSHAKYFKKLNEASRTNRTNC